MTLHELQQWVEGRFGVEISQSTLSKLCKGFRYSIKRVTTRVDAAYSPDLQERRRQYAIWFLFNLNNNVPLLFEDEVGFNITLRQVYGRSLAGTKALTRAPVIRARNISVMATMTRNSLLHFKILEGNGNAENFSDYIDNLGSFRLCRCVYLHSSVLNYCCIIT